jgi:hypothetical protein
MAQYHTANDPLRRETPEDIDARDRRTGWAWIAGAVAVIILLAWAVNINQSHQPTVNGPSIAANNANAPTFNQTAPDGPASRAYTPSPMNPPTQPQPRQ